MWVIRRTMWLQFQSSNAWPFEVQGDERSGAFTGHHSEELQYVPYAIGRGKRAGEENERSEREVPGSAPKGNQNAKKEYELYELLGMD